VKLKRILQYLSGNILLQVFNLALSVLTVKFLPLAQLGQYNLAKSIGGSFVHANLGLRFGLDRRLPVGKEYYNIRQFQVSLMVNTVVSLLMFMGFLLAYGMNWVYIIYAIGGIFFASGSLVRIYYRGIGKVEVFIRFAFWGGMITIFLQLVGVYFMGIYGIVSGYFVATVIVFFVFFDKTLFQNFCYRPTLRYLFSFFKIGLPFLFTSIMVYMSDNVDKFTINHYLGVERVGELGIVLLVYSVSILVPSTILEMFFPEYIKAAQTTEGVREIFKRHVLVSLVVIVIYNVLTAMCLPFVVKLFFAKYLYLLPLMQLVTFAVLPYIAASPFYAVLFAYDKRKELLIVVFSALLIYFISLCMVLTYAPVLKFIVCCKIIYAVCYCLFLFLFIQKNSLLKTNLNS
jgi:O-antigen/teichoic acid export membrane protein